MTPILAAPHEWIEHVCRQFTEATGRPLRFTPARLDGNESTDVHAPVRSHSDGRWFRELREGDRIVGYLYLDAPHEADRAGNRWTVCDLADITARFINTCSSAETSLTSRCNTLSTLMDLGVSLPRQSNLFNVLNQLLRAAVQLTRFRAAAFFLLNPYSNQLNLRGVSGLAPQQIPSPCRDLTADPPDLTALTRGWIAFPGDRDPAASRWLPQGVSTAQCVAVESEAGPMGTLWVFDAARSAPDAGESRVLQFVANQMAALLERVVLLKESDAQHRLQGDLQVAAEVQKTNLLGEYPTDRPFDVACLASSRYELGGDLCEMIPLDDSHTAIAVGDAAGDSVPAALVMSAARGALRAIATDAPSHLEHTDRVMQRMNRAIHSIVPAHQFMSLLYGVLSSADPSFTYTNAGHPTPILLRRGEAHDLKSHGLLLGVMSEAVYDRSVVRLQPEDLLVFFSDGVTEAMNGRHELFRPAGIVAAIEAAEGHTAQDVAQAIWRRLDEHLVGGKEPDDRTLLVVRMRDER